MFNSEVKAANKRRLKDDHDTIIPYAAPAGMSSSNSSGFDFLVEYLQPIVDDPTTLYIAAAVSVVVGSIISFAIFKAIEANESPQKPKAS